MAHRRTLPLCPQEMIVTLAQAVRKAQWKVVATRSRTLAETHPEFAEESEALAHAADRGAAAAIVARLVHLAKAVDTRAAARPRRRAA